LSELPAVWDYNGNGKWEGYTPDCYFNFDNQGFDRDPTNGFTGWRAFAYYPFPSTYWPTNGSTDDVIIRLAKNFRINEKGEFDPMVYRINLAIVEALINKRSVNIEKVDENRFGVDLDKDGILGMADRVVFDWAPLENRNMSYVGQARLDQQQGRVHLAAGLFPEGTEFLQSVRYIDVTSEGDIAPATRMKELRYMKKRTWRTYSDLEESALNEIKEKDDFPDRTRQFIGNPEQGVNNAEGWLLQGFIEDRSGDLRPQSFEETVACIGCHGGTGATTDSVYAFSRKLDAGHYRRGWYHWSQKGLKGINEPKVQIRGAGVFYEYTYYLMYTKSGSEFRDNPEVEAMFYNPDGTIRQDMVDQLHEDITVLLHPSAERALLLNKAYRTIVEDQDFVNGRDINITAMANVHKDIEQDLPTGVKQASSIDSLKGRFGTATICESGGKTAPVDAVHQKVVSGLGMSGPSGVRYEADWQGVIHKSHYNLDIEGVHFTFPPRMTLPTRVVVPLGNIPSCYACHRLDYPTVPGSTKISVPVQSAGDPMVPAAGDLIQLTADTGRNLGGKWSPDGRMIAFVSNRGGIEQIWLMTPDGKNQRQLTRGPAVSGWPEWRADSGRLVFWSYDPETKMHAIRGVNVDGRGLKTLVESREILDRPTYHPDGETIAYAAVHEGNWDIWIIEEDGSGKQRLTKDPQMETNPLWSPDGKMLAYKVAPTTGNYNLTAEYFMAFENGYDEPSVYSWIGPESVQMNAWSPDGKKIAYTAEVIRDASGEDRVTYAAMVSDIAFKGNRAIAENSTIISRNCTLGDRGPVFSPNGKKIVFWAWDTSHRARLWAYDLHTGQTTRLTSGEAEMYPQWSPDGARLLFESDRSGNRDLMIINLR
jgi:Tol biopolymer transport system component